MKNNPKLLKSLLTLGSIFQFTVSFASTQTPVSLESAYFAALKNNRSVPIQQEVVNQSAETARQAIGSLLPTITGTASVLQQPAPTNATVAGIYPTSQPLIKITATQPIFKGFAEYAGLRQTKLQKENQMEQKAQTELTLFTNVVQSFYSILSTENDLKNLHTAINYYDEQIQELKQRVEIGKSQLSDVLTTESSTAGLKAQVELLKGQIEAARETFEFVTGISRDTVLVDDTPAPPQPEPLEHYLEFRDQRPDIRSNRILVDVNHEQINIARAGHLPTINATADYYFLRYGSLSDINWDVGFTVTMPLFSGGNVQSQVRSAASLEHQSVLTLNQTELQAQAQIKSYYQTLIADQAQVKAYKLGAEMAQKNYFELVREYKLGLVAHLNVLTALANFQDTRRNLDKTAYQVKIDWANLQSSIGKRPLLSKETSEGKTP